MYICIYSECMSIYDLYTLCNEHISGYYWEKKGLSCCCVLYITLYYIILYYIILYYTGLNIILVYFLFGFYLLDIFSRWLGGCL